MPCSNLFSYGFQWSIDRLGLFRSDMLLIFYMVWPWFSCGAVCLSAVSLSRQWHNILDFSYCPLSRVLHVTLANWQRLSFIWGHHHLHLDIPRLQFGFQFGLYRVIDPLSFQRSVSLASLFTSLKIHIRRWCVKWKKIKSVWLTMEIESMCFNIPEVSKGRIY